MGRINSFTYIDRWNITDAYFQSDAQVHLEVVENSFRNVAANIWRRTGNDGRPTTSGTDGSLQFTGASSQIGDVGEVAASGISGTPCGTIEGRPDARQIVQVVIAKFAIGAVGDSG